MNCDITLRLRKCFLHHSSSIGMELGWLYNGVDIDTARNVVIGIFYDPLGAATRLFSRLEHDEDIAGCWLRNEQSRRAHCPGSMHVVTTGMHPPGTL